MVFGTHGSSHLGWSESLVMVLTSEPDDSKVQPCLRTAAINLRFALIFQSISVYICELQNRVGRMTLGYVGRNN